MPISDDKTKRKRCKVRNRTRMHPKSLATVLICLGLTVPSGHAFTIASSSLRPGAKVVVVDNQSARRFSEWSLYADPSTSSTSLSRNDETTTNACATRRGFFLSASTAAAAVLATASRPASAASTEEITTTTTTTTTTPTPPRPISTSATCDPTVSVWQNGNRLIYLLGTAHISEQSAVLAGKLVRDTHPSAVFVELDLRRVGGASAAANAVAKDNGIVSTQLAIDPGASQTSRVVIPQIIPVSERYTEPAAAAAGASSSTALSATASSSDASVVVDSSASPPTTAPASPPQSKPNWFRRTVTDWGAALVGKAIRGLYSNLGDAGFSPGEEFVTAIKEGQAIGSDIVLGDQDVQITLRRLSQALAVTDLNKLTDPNSDLEKSMAELFGGSTGGPTIEEASNKTPAEMKQELTSYVEAMKSRESVRKIMGELRQVAPALVQVMLTERDTYMATGLDSLQNYQIVTAVMGIAHQDGVERNLQSFGWKPVVLNCPVKSVV